MAGPDFPHASMEHRHVYVPRAARLGIESGQMLAEVLNVTVALS